MIRLERRPYCPILSNLLSGWRDLDRLQSTIRRPQSENSHSRLSNPFASTRAQQHPGLFWTAVIADERAEKEREAIVRALTETKGRVGGANGAAARMGINRTTLLARLKKLGIDPRQYG